MPLPFTLTSLPLRPAERVLSPLQRNFSIQPLLEPEQGTPAMAFRTPAAPLFQGKVRKMDEDRMEGSGKKLKGDIKEGAGKLTGDQKLQGEGRADKAEGKIQ